MYISIRTNKDTPCLNSEYFLILVSRWEAKIGEKFHALSANIIEYIDEPCDHMCVHTRKDEQDFLVYILNFWIFL